MPVLSEWPKPAAASAKDARQTHGATKKIQKKGGGVLSRNQLSNNTGGNSTFAFVPGPKPQDGHYWPKQKSPKPRRAKQPE